MSLQFEGGVFQHDPSVFDLAYQLVKEYEEHEREQDRRVIHQNIWHKMKSKCSNKTGWYYDNYGAKGIRVCGRWQDSLENFEEDMGPVPEGATGITRKEKDKHFTPENTVWKY